MRVRNQQAYILHRWPYSETSWLLDVFTRDYGRVSLLAKGARRLKSPWRSLLQPCLPLSISYSGKGEVQTLTGADPLAKILFHNAANWICLSYINELLIKLLHRHDAHEALFDAYHRIMELIRTENKIEEWMLRQFETYALKEIGYGILFETDTQQQAIDLDAFYEYFPDIGARRIGDKAESVVYDSDEGLTQYYNIKQNVPTVSGKTLAFLSVQNIFLSNTVVTQETLTLISAKVSEDNHLSGECKVLLRYIIKRVLEWRELKSRKMYVSLRDSLFTGD